MVLRKLAQVCLSLAIAGAAASGALAGCGGGDSAGGIAGGGKGGKGGNGASSGTAGTLNFGGSSASAGSDGGGGCGNLCTQQVSCPNGGKTTVSGTVFAPEGTLPLYNVTVYVPNAPLDPVTHGASCDKCNATLSGKPLVTALTDTSGKFVLENVPVGDNIPLVIQVGKWRRQLTLPNVPQCTDTPLAASETRLPANQSEGDLPLIALTTGGADALECLLRKIGISESEFTLEGGGGMVHLYAGYGGTDSYASNLNGGAAFSNAQNFWASVDVLKIYDVVVLSCEGGQHPGTKGPAALQAMHDYLGMGGRVFASHWHNYWLEQGPQPFPQSATFNHQADLNGITADVDQTFPKGQALAQWLVNVGGSTTLGKIDIKAAQHTVDGVNSTYSQRWIYLDSPTSTQYFSANTPMDVPAEQKCGRIVFSDIHVSSGDQSSPANPYPSGCTTKGLSPQEKVLAFMLFDLSACLIPDDQQPTPPPPVY